MVFRKSVERTRCLFFKIRGGEILQKKTQKQKKQGFTKVPYREYFHGDTLKKVCFFKMTLLYLMRKFLCVLVWI